jgi:hypothetical protein
VACGWASARAGGGGGAAGPPPPLDREHPGTREAQFVVENISFFAPIVYAAHKIWRRVR